MIVKILEACGIKTHIMNPLSSILFSFDTGGMPNHLYELIKDAYVAPPFSWESSGQHVFYGIPDGIIRVDIVIPSWTRNNVNILEPLGGPLHYAKKP